MSLNKRSVVFFIIILFTCLWRFGYAQTAPQKIEELISAYADLYKFNGTVLVAEKGKIIFSKGYGLKNAKDSSRNDVNTIYQLGSITKQFTSAIILQLAEQKKLSLDDRLSKYFPDFPKGDSITIRHLLTHSSGIYNYTNDQKYMASETTKPSDREKMIALFRDKPLNFSPGSKYSYSNSGYLLLGYIIEIVTGKPYEKVVREKIFIPLKMSHSGFDFSHLNNTDKATGYTVFTQFVKMPGSIVDSSVAYAAGAMYSTVGDLFKWHTGLQQYKILTKSSTEAAYTPYLFHYGFGWAMDTLFEKKIVEHGGGIIGFNTIISRVPSDDVAVILLSNMNVAGLDKLSHSLLAVLYNKPYEIPKPKTEVELNESVLKEYVGEYELAPGFILKITLAGKRLKVQATGQPAYDLFAESNDRFFLKVVEATATFMKGPDGKVEKMLWKQQGSERPAKKIK